MNKFLKQIEREHEVRRKDATLFDGFLVVITIIPIGFELFSSFEYFYQNYFIYAFFSSFLLMMTLFYLIPKWINIKFKELQYILISILILGISFFFIPKLLHYIFLPKTNQCFVATLLEKRLLGRSNDKGKIKFDIIFDKDTPSKFIGYSTLSDVPVYEYELLPKLNSKIKICGEISKVGYQYTSIEAIK